MRRSPGDRHRRVHATLDGSRGTRLNRLLEVVLSLSARPGAVVPVADIEAAFSAAQRRLIPGALMILVHQGTVEHARGGVRHNLTAAGAPPRWHTELAEVDRLAQEAEAARGERRRQLLVRAARILVRVVLAGEPRVGREAFRKAEWAAEVRVGGLARDCVGCLAEQRIDGDPVGGRRGARRRRVPG